MLKRAYLEITNVCNLRCDFCPGTRRPPAFMDRETFRLLARRLRPHTDYLYLHLMGEPLLHPDLPALLAIAGDLGFRLCLTTNGTLLPRRSGALLAAGALHKVSVSLHSQEGSGRWDPDYLEGVWDFCARAADRGVICALRLWNLGSGARRNGEVLSFLAEKLGRDPMTCPLPRPGSRRLGENLYLEQAERFQWPDLSAPPAGTTFCLGLRDQVGVLADGTVVPCCLDHEGDIPLGSLLEEELETILASPRARAIYEGFSRRQPPEELCRRCGYASRF